MSQVTSDKRSGGLSGLQVAAFESRLAPQIGDLIAKHGGRAVVAPSMREVPLAENAAAFRFGEELFAGRIDVLVCLTGVGTGTLVQTLETRWPRQKIVEALARPTIVARGPKPLSVLRELGMPVILTVPEPNTWRELLALLDAQVPVRGRRVAVQEYGIENAELIAGLEERGASVLPVPVYRWALPEDTGPLKSAIRAICDGEIDVVLFTSSNQVTNVLRVAAEEGREAELRRALERRVVVASVGPTSSETLRADRLPVDLEPQRPKMGHLVNEVAQRARELIARKRGQAGVESRGSRVESRAERVESRALRVESWKKAVGSSAFMKACRREAAEYTPIWLMRQAGRYMAEYRKIRATVPFMEMCKRPEIAAEVTVTAAERLGVDAAIIFADILLPLEPMGISLEFAKGEGPQIHRPVRAGADVDRIKELESVEPLSFVFEAVRQARAALEPNIPLSGFAGAPFTLASYLIEGGGSRTYQYTKTLMYRDSGAWHELLGRLARALVKYLNAQIESGAQAVQLFDSWVGCLGPADYREFVLPHSRYVLSNLQAGVPAIHFATGNPALLELMREAGGDVIGLDWRVELDAAWERLGPGVGVMGNLDPVALLAEPPEIRRQAERILKQAAGRPGHIFNLGHGVLSETRVENVVALVEAVHELSNTLT